MKKTKLIILAIISIALILLVVQNTKTIQTQFLWIEVRMPAIVLLFLTAAGGFAAGLLTAVFMKKGLKRRK